MAEGPIVVIGTAPARSCLWSGMQGPRVTDGRQLGRRAQQSGPARLLRTLPTRALKWELIDELAPHGTAACKTAFRMTKEQGMDAGQ